MEFHFAKLTEEDRKPVIDIFNYYIEKSFAAYIGKKVEYEFFDEILKGTKGNPAVTVRTAAEKIIGFAFLKGYNPHEACNKVALASCYLKPEFAGKGIGKNVLEYLASEGKAIGIISILATLSSVNERGIKFYRNNGYVECGRFKGVRRKFSIDYDEIWMQKEL